MKRKWLASILAVIMLISSVPVHVLAGEDIISDPLETVAEVVDVQENGVSAEAEAEESYPAAAVPEDLAGINIEEAESAEETAAVLEDIEESVTEAEDAEAVSAGETADSVDFAETDFDGTAAPAEETDEAAGDFIDVDSAVFTDDFTDLPDGFEFVSEETDQAEIFTEEVPAAEAEEEPEASIILEADGEPATYTILLDAGEGVFYVDGTPYNRKDFSVPEGEEFYFPDAEFPSPDDTVIHEFLGWYDKDDVDFEGNWFEADDWIYVYESMELTARWETSYKVTFDPGSDGYFPSGSEGIDYYSAEELIWAPEDPENTDGSKIFAGWTDTEGGTTPVSPEEYDPAENPVFYAIWLDGITVTFHAGAHGYYEEFNDETGNYEHVDYAQITYTEIDDYLYLLIPYSSDEEYMFLGWNTKADYSGTFYYDYELEDYGYYDLDEIGTEFYAVWGKWTTVTLNANGGYFWEYDEYDEYQEVPTYSFSAYEGYSLGAYEDELRVPDHKDANYLFRGWSASQNGPVITDLDNEILKSGAVYYAVWEYSDLEAELYCDGQGYNEVILYPGTTLRLICNIIFGENSPFTYQWKKGNTTLATYSMVEDWESVFSVSGLTADTVYSCVVSDSAGNSVTASIEVLVPSVSTIRENVPVTVKFAGEKHKFYKFTPQTDGVYVFASENYQYDPKAELYDASFDMLAEGDDEGDDRNFIIRYPLRAGNDYYLDAGTYDQGKIDEYTLTVKKLGFGFVKQNYSCTILDGETAVLEPEIVCDSLDDVTFSWSAADPDDVLAQGQGAAYAKYETEVLTEGDYYYMCSASCDVGGETLTEYAYFDVQVLSASIERILTGEEKSVDEQNKQYMFVPEEDGRYEFWLEADELIDITLTIDNSRMGDYYYYPVDGKYRFTLEELKKGTPCLAELSYEDASLSPGEMNGKFVITRHVHSMEKNAKIEATCTEEGYKEHYWCDSCWNYFADPEGTHPLEWNDIVIRPAGHMVVPVSAVAATCTTAGKTAGTRCSKCGQVFKAQDSIAALGHVSDGGKVTKAAACTTAGVKTYTCTRCKKVIRTETIPATGHSWNAGVVTTAATTAAAGVKTYTCTKCKITRTEVIPKIPAPAEDPAKKAAEEAARKAAEEAAKKAAEAARKAQAIKDVEAAAGKKVTSTKDNGEPAGSSFAKIQVKSTKQTKNSIKLSWNKVSGASAYDVYGNMCGKKYSYEKIARVTGTSYTVKKLANGKKLKKGTYHKFIVIAYGTVNDTYQALATSKSIHVATSGGSVTNVKSVTVKSKNKKVTKLSLKKKKSVTVKAEQKAQNQKKLTKHRKIMFESSDPTIATVNTKGKIVAKKKKGSCTIYAYSQSGVFAKVKITVK